MKSDIRIIQLLMTKPILHVLSVLSMSDRSYLNHLLPQQMFQKISFGGMRTSQFNISNFFQSRFFDLTTLKSFPREYNSPFDILCPYISDMTKPIVIQIEHFFPREYSRVCGEYKGNFEVCLNHHRNKILITSVPDFLLLVYFQLFFLVQGISFFSISSFSFFHNRQKFSFSIDLVNLAIGALEMIV